MKLSLYKQLVKNGEDNEAIYNGGEAGKKLFDVKIEGMLKLSPDFKGIIKLISVNDTCSMVYLIKPLSSRLGDYRAMVVAIPHKVAFYASDDIPAVVDDVEQTLAEGGDTARLARWFQRDYDTQDFVWEMKERTNKYAYRIYGRGCKPASMAALLGQAMLQDAYTEYEGVFLLDVDSKNMAREEAMTDLSAKILQKPAVLVPPPVVSMPKGSTLYIGKNEFGRPVLTHIGANVKLNLRKRGCLDYENKVKVTSTINYLSAPAKVDWVYKVYAKIFRVIDEDGADIKSGGTKLDVEGTLDTNKKEQYLSVPETVAQNAVITVERAGFETKKMVADLTRYSETDQLEIQLSKAREKIKYKIGKRIAFEVERTEEEAELSPLPDYVVAGRKGNVVTLKRKDAAARRRTTRKNSSQRAALLDKDGTDDNSFFNNYWVRVGAIALLSMALGGAIGWFLGERHGVDGVNAKLEEMKVAEQQKLKHTEDSLRSVAMTAYLDSVPNWKQAELDSVFDGRMKGLYETLNTYNFDSLLTLGQQLGLDSCKQWAKIDSVVTSFNTKPEYKQKLMEMTKNEDSDKKKFFSSDGTITLDNLITFMNEAKTAVDNEKK